MRTIFKHLNLWQRLFIVLTMVWLIVGTDLIWWCKGESDYDRAAFFERICESNANSSGIQNCWTEYTREMTAIGNGRWDVLVGVFLGALGVAAVVWLLGAIAYWVVRWILAGRSAGDISK